MDHFHPGLLCQSWGETCSPRLPPTEQAAVGHGGCNYASRRPSPASPVLGLTRQTRTHQTASALTQEQNTDTQTPQMTPSPCQARGAASPPPWRSRLPRPQWR